MNKSLSVIFFAGSFSFLTGCSALFGDEGYFKNRGDEYLKAEEIPQIDVDDSNEERFAEIYVVPDIEDSTYDYGKSFDTPRPIPLSSTLLEDTVKIQKLSSRQWVFITSSPSEIWPQVREFLGDRDLSVSYTDPTEGIIETSWLQFSDDRDHYDRYQIRIESGIQPDSAEIHILHHQTDANGQPDSKAIWPKASSVDSREAWMVDELSSTLASNLQRSSSSLLAQTIGGDYKVVLEESDSGEPVLKMKIDYLRAWASIAHALGKDGFYLWDRKNDLGIYYAHYETPKKKKSTWLGRGIRSVSNAISGKSSSDQPQTPYTIDQVITHLPASDDLNTLLPSVVPSTEKLDDVPGYLVLISGDDRNVEVRVRNAYAEKIDPKDAKQLLSLVRNNLI